METEIHPLHQKNKELQISPNVERAVERQKRRTGERVPNDPTERINAYMDRLENIFLNPDEHTRKRNIELFRDKIYDAFIIKPDVAVEQILKDEAKVASDRGHGEIKITEEMKNRPETQEQAEAVIKKQKTSLDEWMDYLTSSDTSSYDPWFKYYLWNSIIKLQNLVKIEKIDKLTGEKITTAEYPERSPGTLKQFPDIFRGKLAQIYDKYNKYIAGEKTDEVAKQYFKRNFAKTYAEESLDHILNASVENKEQTHGDWVSYKKGDMNDAAKMISSLKDKYTDWCIEGEGVGKDKLNEGDIYIYYTYDKSGNLTDPRMCIRMRDNHIEEVRGISGGKSQEVEQVFMDEAGEGGSVLGNKLKEFGNEADAYKKRETDMKTVTLLKKKSQRGELFTKEELEFLYEINATIEGFGYQKDPRVAELLAKRNKEEDASIVFGCQPQEIAWKQEDINEKTKAYIGEWSVEVFQKIKNYPNIEHLYESFPEKKILMQTLKTSETMPMINSPQTAEEALKQKGKKGIYLTDWGKDILYETEFSQENQNQTYNLVRFSVGQLGLERGGTLEEIRKRAEDLGLDICPAEVGPHLRLQNDTREWTFIAMKPITDSYGRPSVFLLRWGVGQLLLSGSFAGPGSGWSAGNEFVFRFRKLET